ncbi:Protein CBG13895 [Caenorhabditis briggsae]|uniref:Protein CBG13895 n=2 Tax=Caenorhabditis briggsae TaxID=6238 RepID=A8XJ34_CAEBR|nr:Protein CBG13895 [Caenorhabditis briggsae]ULT97831.1 hypothetical protein L3Y34_005576 [Caenorhabditis briggsae]CAP32661.1 Protein CBG13895 [Caenorhabditis briggsae]
MPRITKLIILACLVLYVCGDQIVPAAFQKIFPKAGATKVKALTTNVNKQTVIAKAKEVVKKWMPNWVEVSPMVVDYEAQAKAKAAAQKKALTFIDYRFSLKKYINYVYNQAVSTKYLTLAEADSMRTLLWSTDKKAKNDWSVASVNFMTEASKKIQKTPSFQQKITDFTGNFAKANPKDYANLKWTF